MKFHPIFGNHHKKCALDSSTFYLYILFIYLSLFKEDSTFSDHASLQCVPLKHIYIYIQVKHMIKT